MSSATFHTLWLELHDLHEQLSRLCQQPKPVLGKELERLRAQVRNAEQLAGKLRKLDRTESSSSPAAEGTLVSKVIAFVDKRLARDSAMRKAS